MDINKIVLSIETGIGGQLGHLTLVFGLGAMLRETYLGGKEAATSCHYADWQIREGTNTGDGCGCLFYHRYCAVLKWSLVLLLIPIVYAIAKELKMPFLYLGIDGRRLKSYSQFCPASCSTAISGLHTGYLYWPGAAFWNHHRCSTAVIAGRFI